MTSPGGGTPGLPGSGAEDTKDISQRLADQMKNPAGLILSQVFARILSVLSGFLSLGDLLGNIARAITGNGAFGGEGALVDIFGFGQQTRFDLGDLQDRTQDLEGVIGYSHSYSSGGISSNPTAGDIKLSMTNVIGSNVGTTFTNGGVVLLSKGLWVASLPLTADYYNPPFASYYVNAQIRVYAPDGSLHAQRIFEADTMSRTSLHVHLPFTVKTAGYRVEAWCNAAAGRGIKGGSVWNGLSVEKRSLEKE